MRALVVTRHGGPEVLAVQERAAPVPGPGEVRIAVEAAGLNFADLLARTGAYPDAPPVPSVLGYEVAGTVESVGAGVTSVAVGTRVMAATRFGGQAELAVAGASDVVPLGERWDAPSAAAIPVNYGTAYAALVLMAGIRPGERVLVHAAAGGVGLAAVQIARHLGAEVIGTASAAKHSRVLAEGATHVIDYRTRDFADEVRLLTAGEGVDVILDALGPTSLRKGWRLLRPGGRVIVYGLSEAQTGDRRDVRALVSAAARYPFAAMPWWKGPMVMNENRGIFGLNLKHWWDREGSLARIIDPLRELMDAGVIRPVVDSSFPFEAAAEAHRRLQGAQNIGKVVLTPR